MFTIIKKHHRKALLSAPIVFLLLSHGEVPPGNSLYLQPVSYFPEVGSTFSVELDFRSGIPVNATDGAIHFSPRTLSVDHIDTSKSAIDLWGATPEWTNESGEITWSGGIIKPLLVSGKQEGNVLRVVFRANRSAPVDLTIDDASLLTSDGRGKNVLQNTGTIRIYPRKKGSASPDIDADRKLSARDVAQVVMAVGKRYDPRYDINGDNVVDFKDVTTMLDYYEALR